MSISAMKQALDAIEKIIDGCNNVQEEKDTHGDAKTLAKLIKKDCFPTLETLRQAIAEAENQDPIAWLCEADVSRSGGWKWSLCFVRSDKDCFRNWEPLFTTPVHASDISEKHIHISDKYRHEWIGLDHEQMRNTPIEFNRGALWAERYLKEKNT